MTKQAVEASPALPLRPGLLKRGRQATDILEGLKGKTFALPSHSIMFTLLAMFAGKPEKIPRQLLGKPDSERTPAERRQAREFISSLFQRRTTWGHAGQEESSYAIVCNNPKVEAEAVLPLFRDDEREREEGLALYIKRTFGAEGLRHLLGLIIALEENARQGHFSWNVNEHLDRLGFKRKQRGHFDQEQKMTAAEIVEIFCSLYITATRKDGKTTHIRGKRLFTITEFDFTRDDATQEILNGGFTIRAENYWYGDAFKQTDDISAQYTRLLKDIAKENHRNHPRTIYLAPLLAIWWRMKPGDGYKIELRLLADWCDLRAPLRNLRREIADLEGELNYMKSRNYLGEWSHDGEAAHLADCKDPLSCTLTLHPPVWLQECLKQIEQRRETEALLPAEDDPGGMTVEDFLTIQGNLSNNQFANHLGISAQMVGYIRSGKRDISKRLAEKVREFAEKMGR